MNPLEQYQLEMTRRQLLSRSSKFIGAAALTSLLAQDGVLADNPVPGGNAHSSDLGILGGDPPHALGRSRETQRLLDCQPSGFRFSPHLCPLFRIFAKEAHHLSQHLGGCFVSRDQKLLKDAEHFSHGQWLVWNVRVFVLVYPGIKQVGEDVITRIVPALFQLVSEVVLELNDTPLSNDSLVVRDLGANARDVVVAN